MAQQLDRPFESMSRVLRVAMGVVALASWLTDGEAHAGTVTIAATPNVVEEVEMVAQAFESAHPNDRVQIAIASKDEWKNSAKRAPVQIIVSDDPAFIDWLEARDVAKRVGTDPGVHMPLAVVASASTGKEIDSLRDLHTHLQQPGTTVAISDPDKTDCGRRSVGLLKSIGLLPSSPQVISVKHSAQVIESVRMGKAQLGIVFSPEAIVAKDIKIHAVSAPQAGSPVHVFVVKRGQQDHAVAKRFLAFVNSPEAQQVLKARGYDMLQAHQAGEGEVVVVAQGSIVGQ